MEKNTGRVWGFNMVLMRKWNQASLVLQNLKVPGWFQLEWAGTVSEDEFNWIG